jgi:excisionase family DNA binding protein
MTRAVADWITLAEAAEILAAANIHVRAETLGRWARSGRLQSIKPGGRRYVRRAQIKALLRPRRRVPAEALQPGLFEELAT